MACGESQVGASRMWAMRPGEEKGLGPDVLVLDLPPARCACVGASLCARACVCAQSGVQVCVHTCVCTRCYVQACMQVSVHVCTCLCAQGGVCVHVSV